MTGNDIAFAVTFLAGFSAAFAIYVLLRSSTTALLDQVVDVQAGTTFYLRVLLLCLLLGAAAGVLDHSYDLKPNAHFMEYVWRIAAGLSSVFFELLMVLLAFLTLLTVLVAVLRRRV